MPLSVIETVLKNCVSQIQNIKGLSYGLSAVRMKRINVPMVLSAFKVHSSTGDVAALRHDLRNGIRHYFGDHTQCRSPFCKHTTTDTSNIL